MYQRLPGEFGSANRTAVISSRYRSLHMSHVPVFARARYLCKNSSESNIRRNPGVMVRIEALCVSATARVLDREIDRELCEQVAAIAVRKYDWVDGLPVEITPVTPATESS